MKFNILLAGPLHRGYCLDMSSSKQIWIFAGETSGDLYGAHLASEIQRTAPGVRIRGMGGCEMRKAGVEIMVDSTELGIVGVVEVLKHLFFFVRLFLRLRKKAIEDRPDAVVLIDYPGFNIRFARAMRKAGIPVIWYVSPQVWAWAKWRIPKLARDCSKMLVIFPFETEVYSGTGLETYFVGHPLTEIMEGVGNDIARDGKMVLLLPGSRENEIDRLMDPMLETVSLLAQRNPELKFRIAAARPAIEKLIEEKLESFRMKNPGTPDIPIVCGETSLMLFKAAAGIAASGTVTVEAAIAGLPLVVIYKMNHISYLLGRIFVKIPFFTMVNIINGRESFREFLQGDVKPAKLADALLEILPGGARRSEVEEDMDGLKRKLSVENNSGCVRAAKIIIETINAEK